MTLLSLNPVKNIRTHIKRHNMLATVLRSLATYITVSVVLLFSSEISFIEADAKITELKSIENSILLPRQSNIHSNSNHKCSNITNQDKCHSRSKRQLNLVNTKLDDDNCDEIQKEIEKSEGENKLLKKCYYCNSSTDHYQHTCGDEMFGILLNSELKNLTYQCPWGGGNFCFKRRSWNSTWDMTLRGCTGDEALIFRDKHAFHIRNECAYLDNGIYHSIVCFCDTDFCNVGQQLSPIVLMPIVSLVLNIFCLFRI